MTEKQRDDEELPGGPLEGGNLGGDYARDSHIGGFGDDYARDQGWSGAGRADDHVADPDAIAPSDIESTPVDKPHIGKASE